MKNQVLSGQFVVNQFVKEVNGGIESFGIVNAVDLNGSLNLMLVDMQDDFGTVDSDISNIVAVEESEIVSILSEVSKRFEEFPYFIIQLNDIPELSKYHILENEFIAKIRATNESLNYVI